jgi:hypothetical protein
MALPPNLQRYKGLIGIIAAQIAREIQQERAATPTGTRPPTGANSSINSTFNNYRINHEDQPDGREDSANRAQPQRGKRTQLVGP